MRNTFINTLCELASTHEDIFLLCGDLGYSVLEPFAQRYPDRYINVGVAEQNMTLVAAGLAREGYNVFTYSIGNFPTLRCMEQIRYDVCYHQANVKIVAVGAGYAYGPQGASHHLTEDFAMLRALPGMKVCAPADAAEAAAAATYMASHAGPGYVRLNKSGEPAVHPAERTISLVPGQFISVLEGAGTAVLACGAIVERAMSQVKAANNGWAVYSSPFVGGYEQAQLLELARRYSGFVTMEEHQLNGGFGSSIIESFSDLYATGVLKQMPAVRRIAIPNRFVDVSGSQDYLRDLANLTISDRIG